MKKALKIFLFSLIGVFCLSSCGKDDPVEEEQPPVEYVEYFDENEILASPPYDGPIYKFDKFQNPDAWKGPVYSLEKRFELTQVPEEELSELGTEGMAASVMFHPLRSNWIAYIHVWTWFDIMIPYSNLLTELSERPNGAGYLLKVYKNMRVPTDDVMDIDMFSLDINDRCLFLDHGFLALLLSTDVFFKQLSSDGCKLLALIAFEKFSEMYECPEHYSWTSMRSPLVASATALLEIADLTDDERKTLTDFVNVSGIVDAPEYVPIANLIQKEVIEVYSEMEK